VARGAFITHKIMILNALITSNEMPLLYFTKSLASEGPYVKKPSHRHVRGFAVANLVETLRYKDEGRGFDPR
jgi:hypothetical protein